MLQDRRMGPYELLSRVLELIEDRRLDRVSIVELAAAVSLSAVHLQRVFKFAFGLPLASYIRSRRLTAAVERVLTSDLNMIDIALECGFEHEQSFIRSFRREFDMTPGSLRRQRVITRVTPPLQMIDCRRVSQGILFGPEVVFLPELHFVGRQHRILFSDSVDLPPLVARRFWEQDRQRIRNVIGPSTYYGLTRIPNYDDGWSYYLPAVQVKDLRSVAEGLQGDTFPASLCVRFHYVGQHHYYDLNANVAQEMYSAIIEFIHAEEARYTCLHDQLYLERIDTSQGEVYCQLEWFTPIYQK